MGFEIGNNSWTHSNFSSPWVHTPPERFKEYRAYLKSEAFNVIALKDVKKYRATGDGADDPLTLTHYPQKK